MNDSKLNKIILVGHLMINVPAVIISFGLPIMAFNLIESTVLRIIFSMVGFILGIVLSWLLWSFLITKWRLWAFKQIEEDNWYKLKELAIINKLIWDDGSDFELTEIRTIEENEQIIDIAERISEQVQIEEIKLDLNTTQELRFKFNKSGILAESILKLLLVIVSIGLVFTNQILLGFLLLGIVLFYGDSFKLVKHAFHNKDYLVINEKRILLNYPKAESFYWEEISKLTINAEQRKMIIVKKNGDKLEEINCELGRFNIKNYRKFKHQIRVFIDRYVYNEIKNGS